MSTVWKALEALVASLIALFAPIEATLMTAAALVVIDWLTARIALKDPGGTTRSLAKLVIYLIVIMLSFVVDKYLTMGAIVVLNMVTSIIGITELKNIVQNINIISGVSLLNSILGAITAAQPKLPTDTTPPSPPEPPAAS